MQMGTVYSIDLGIAIHGIVTALDPTVALGGRGEVEGLGQISNSSMAKLKQVGDDLGGTFAVALFNETDDAIGSDEVVGVAPIDLVIGRPVVDGVVEDEVLLDQDGEGVSQRARRGAGDVLELRARQTAIFCES